MRPPEFSAKFQGDTLSSLCQAFKCVLAEETAFVLLLRLNYFSVGVEVSPVDWLVAMQRLFWTFLFLFLFQSSVSVAEEGNSSLSGHLLIAAEKMLDYRFAGTVIYILRHSKNGALGLVINRPVALVPADSIAEQFELEVDTNHSDVQMFWGGPVHISRSFFLHSPDYINEGSDIIADGVVLTRNNEILGAVLEGTGPKNLIFALVCAGWGPGQLERELFREDWFVLQTKSAFVFDTDRFEMWEAAMDQLGVEL